MLSEGVEPFLALFVGGAACGEAEGVWFAVARGVRLADEILPPLPVGDDDVGELEPGEVEGLRRRGECRRSIRHSRQGGERRRADARIGQIGVDLVREDDDVEFCGEVGQSEQLLAGPHPADRIVGVAQDHRPGAGIDERRLEGGEIANVSPLPIARERRVDRDAAVVFDD